MKKKLTILSLVVAITTFSTVSLGASYASDYKVSDEKAPLISQSASASVEPQALASLARKAVVYGKAAWEANKDALREVTRNGSLLGTGVSSSDVENVDVIFDK
ncbi:hypothetical protein ACE3NQ_19255 [Paenibacillus terreus]|uniref:Uncharacterized protein n=1 Tax=Paenibacillus terreus TaxID=1387834 RepID=A0ABV5BCH6_9BACL